MRNSGKLLILAMFLVAFVAASASWWFRYSATHRAAQFWGPEGARLIRDAPRVELVTLRPAEKVNDEITSDEARPADEIRLGRAVWTIVARHDISAAHGLVHLRSALLEDRSFDWTKDAHPPKSSWDTALLFRDAESKDSLSVLFTPEFDLLQSPVPGTEAPRTISCGPIAAGLAETTAEWSQEPAAR
jgi:hypothetical protein